MRALMISLDKTLIGADYSGDALERHLEYARHTDNLSIIVFSGRGFQKKNFGLQLSVFPTNSIGRWKYFFDAVRIAGEIYQKNKFDLVVTQDPFLTGLVGWWIKRKFKTKLLVHFHGDFWKNKYWLKERWFNRPFLILSGFLVKRADAVRVVSSGIKDKLVERGIDNDKIRIIPTPVDLEKFFRVNSDFHKYKTIINVGRDDPSKDYETLFKAINLIHKKYKNFVFAQIGASLDLREKIKANDDLMLISTKKINQSELANYYALADVYVSSSCHESFGKVLIEAMASGLPVVATATIGSKEIVEDDKSGFLAEVGDFRGLADKILYLLNNPHRAKEMGAYGQKIVKEKFNREKIIREIIKYWEEIV